MANNYMQFSEVIGNITDEEAAWITEKLNQVEEADLDTPGLDDWQQDIVSIGWLGFSWQIEGESPDRLLWIHHGDESGSVEAIPDFICAFLSKFRPNDYFTLEWATWCSKPRIREFSGGAIFITATDVFWHTPETFFEDKKNQLSGLKQEINTL
jgi:hypothetical protein